MVAALVAAVVAAVMAAAAVALVRGWDWAERGWGGWPRRRPNEDGVLLRVTRLLKCVGNQAQWSVVGHMGRGRVYRVATPRNATMFRLQLQVK